ncbi:MULTISPECIES: hypothetical protein [unclassified Crossiella]|uniref:hypothetical protein n=1 Tax=unclassified Crossiella TaxID=2620835 RepID=UPI001FFFEDEB|nr:MULTISPECIES: hypothetical protein [unclassified Crossiella]MCK2237736.1 hypothetical protein [Crossiella sp. S99.2]MCK2255022.1 hypothetical protein [Crossiella sp. S99.1]
MPYWTSARHTLTHHEQLQIQRALTPLMKGGCRVSEAAAILGVPRDTAMSIWNYMREAQYDRCYVGETRHRLADAVRTLYLEPHLLSINAIAAGIGHSPNLVKSLLAELNVPLRHHSGSTWALEGVR